MSSIEVVKSEKVDKPNYISKIIFAFIIGVVIIVVINLMSGKNSYDYESAAQQVIDVENRYSLNSYYSVGKILTKKCDLEQSLEEWKMFKCNYTYNPLNGAGNIMLDRENNDSVYVAIKFNTDDTFSYKFDSTIENLRSKLD